jgi:ATP-binding cassette subfamily C protein
MNLIYNFLRAYPWKSAIALMAMLFAGLAEGIGISTFLPLLGIAIDYGTGSSTAQASESASELEQMVRNLFETVGITPTIGTLLTVFIVSILIQNALLLIANVRVGYIIVQITKDLRLELIRTIFVSRWEYFIRQPVGHFTNAFQSEIARTAAAYQHGIRIIVTLLHAAVYAGLVFLVSWQVSLAAITATVVFFYSLRIFTQRSKRFGDKITKLMQALTAQMTDSLVMIKPLKSMARGRLAETVLIEKTKRLKTITKKLVLAGASLGAFQDPIILSFLALGIYITLVYFKLPLANVLIVIYLLTKLFKQFKKIQKENQLMKSAESAYWSLQDKLQAARQAKEPLPGSRQPVLNNGIRLDRVGFAYDKRWILQDATLTFPVGSFTAIVGPSGVGKTSVVDLITGLLRPQAGEIWIDGLPMSEIDLLQWRRMIGYVPQETLLLHNTISMNVTLGDETLTTEDVTYALKAAGAWDFVKALPERMDSIVGERGHMLSGGQRQRIAIARALVHKPKLLILDEATTALDPENEAAICRTLGDLRGEMTILAISHQSAVLEVADRSYRLEDGKAILVTDRKAEETEGASASTAIV